MEKNKPGKCHLCGAMELRISQKYSALARVTSDCKPWQSGGTLARCGKCGHVQTVVNRRWREECNAIYREYTIYFQSGGSEQHVFNPATGQGGARSDKIVAELKAHVALPENGRLLDIGCGNGSFLRACSAALPGWRLFGTEFDEKYKAQVMAIPGVGGMFAVDVSKVPGQFDLISLVHVFEHIPAPLKLLRKVLRKLKPGGLLLVEVPDCECNPFMLTVADHCSHFATNGLAEIIGSAGFEPVVATNQWVAKEITVVGRKPLRSRPVRVPLLPEEETQRIFAHVEWLDKVARQVQRLGREDNFGIFGTSIAANWLHAQTGGVEKFFVDEEVSRQGKMMLERPILAPAAVPAGSVVYVALPAQLARKIARRLSRPGVRYIVPPPVS